MKQRRFAELKKPCAGANAHHRAALTGPRPHDFALWAQKQ